MPKTHFKLKNFNEVKDLLKKVTSLNENIPKLNKWVNEFKY